VRVAQGHLDVSVAQDRLQGLEASAAHHEPRGEAVPQVVEVQAVQLGLALSVALERHSGECLKERRAHRDSI